MKAKDEIKIFEAVHKLSSEKHLLLLEKLKSSIERELKEGDAIGLELHTEFIELCRALNSFLENPDQFRMPKTKHWHSELREELHIAIEKLKECPPEKRKNLLSPTIKFWLEIIRFLDKKRVRIYPLTTASLERRYEKLKKTIEREKSKKASKKLERLTLLYSLMVIPFREEKISEKITSYLSRGIKLKGIIVGALHGEEIKRELLQKGLNARIAFKIDTKRYGYENAERLAKGLREIHLKRKIIKRLSRRNARRRLP